MTAKQMAYTPHPFAPKIGQALASQLMQALPCTAACRQLMQQQGSRAHPRGDHVQELAIRVHLEVVPLFHVVGIWHGRMCSGGVIEHIATAAAHGNEQKSSARCRKAQMPFCMPFNQP